MDKEELALLRKRVTHYNSDIGLTAREARQVFAHIDELYHAIKTARSSATQPFISMPKTCDTTTTTPCPHCQTGDGGHYPLNPDTIAYGGIEIAMSVHCKHIRARGYPNGTDAPFEGMDVVPINFCPFLRAQIVRLYGLYYTTRCYACSTSRRRPSARGWRA